MCCHAKLKPRDLRACAQMRFLSVNSCVEVLDGGKSAPSHCARKQIYSYPNTIVGGSGLSITSFTNRSSALRGSSIESAYDGATSEGDGNKGGHYSLDEEVKMLHDSVVSKLAPSSSAVYAIERPYG